ADAVESWCPWRRPGKRCAPRAASSGARCGCGARFRQSVQQQKALRQYALPRLPCSDRAPGRAAARNARNCYCCEGGSCEGSFERGRPRLRGSRPDTQRVTDGVSQLGTIERVEVKVAHAVTRQLLHLINGNTGCDEAPRLGIVLQTVKALLEPVGDLRSTTLRHARQRWESRDGHHSRDDGDIDTGGGATVAKAQKDLSVKEKLRDGTRGARIDLLLQTL